MLFNVLVAKRRYSCRQYVQVGLITFGIIVFNLAKIRGSKTGTANLIEDQPIGILLLLASLCCDGMTASYQRMFMDEFRPSTHKLMAGMNLWSLVILIMPLILTGQGYEGVRFCANHPDIVKSILWFSLCSAVGQNFIFYTITGPGPLVCATITTTRKFFTILLSVLLHPDNELLPVQWIAVCTVFMGLGGEIQFKYAKSLITGSGGAVESMIPVKQYERIPHSNDEIEVSIDMGTSPSMTDALSGDEEDCVPNMTTTPCMNVQYHSQLHATHNRH